MSFFFNRKKSGKLKASYKRECFSIGSNVDIDFAGPTIYGWAVLALEGWLAGYQMSFDTAKSKLSQNNFALGYKAADFQLHTHVWVFLIQSFPLVPVQSPKRWWPPPWGEGCLLMLGSFGDVPASSGSLLLLAVSGSRSVWVRKKFPNWAEHPGASWILILWYPAQNPGDPLAFRSSRSSVSPGLTSAACWLNEFELLNCMLCLGLLDAALSQEEKAEDEVCVFRLLQIALH